MEHLLTNLGTIPPLAVYAFVGLWLTAESTGFPIPNEVVLILAGSLAAQGRVSPVLLVLSAVAGSLLGANIAYAVGWRGGRVAVLRFGRLFRLDETRLDAIEAQFARAGVLAIFLARLTPFIRTVASFPAGMLRMPRRSFEAATTLGSLVWCVVMVVLGDLLGANYLVAVRLIDRYTLPAVLVVVALIVGYVWLHHRIERATDHLLSEAERDALHEREAHPKTRP